MTDDETKKDESTEAESSEAEAAGPVADDASDAQDDAPESSDAPEAEQAEPAAAEAEPAAKESAPAEEAAEPNPEDELPWKERRRLQRSRQPHKAGPALTVEERAAKRTEERKLKAGSRRKERAATKADKTAGTGTPVAEKDAVAAKTRQGIVVSNKGEKSITVRIDIARRHPTYEKVVRRSRTLHAHDEQNEAGEGDTVRIVETRPLSKTKRWRLVEVVEKAK
jgi:small subunit ribosomal protein S17